MRFAILGHLFPEVKVTRDSIKNNPNYKLEMDGQIFCDKKEIYVSLAGKEAIGYLLGIMWTPQEMIAALGDEDKFWLCVRLFLKRFFMPTLYLM